MLAVTRDALPPFRGSALLLDLDGTLIDIAPTPDAVVVPSGLMDVLLRLGGFLDNALAVVTGRPIEAIDGLLGAMPFAVAGEHGGAIRPAPDAAVERAPLPSPPDAWLERAAVLEAAFPGTILERKARGFGIHYRLAPAAGPAIEAAIAEMIQGSLEFELMPGKMICEVRPRGVDKGDAVRGLMCRAPFLGRVPVFIGDDVTDEDGMRAARAMGGAGLRVPEVFADAAGVRVWLAATAARGDWGEAG